MIIKPIFERQRSLSRLMRRYAWTVPIVAGVGILSSTLEGIGIGFLIPLVSNLMQSESGPSGFIGAINGFALHFDESTRLPVIGCLIFLFVSLKCLAQMLNRLFVSWADGKIGHEIRCDLSRRLLEVDYQFFFQHERGRIINTLAIESWRAAEAIRAQYTLVGSVAAVSIFAILLLVVSWQMTTAVLVGIILIRVMRRHFGRHMQALSKEISAANVLLSERMYAAIDMVRPARIFGEEEREQKGFLAVSEKSRRALLRVEATSSRIEPALEIAHTALFVIVLIGAKTLGLDVPVIVAFLVLLYRMQPYLRAAEHSNVQLDSLVSSIREVEWLLGPPETRQPAKAELQFETLRQSVAFEGVSFSYSNSDQTPTALSDISLVIPKGEATALIGPSGAGKTTIVNLLCGLIKPTMGRILIDGRDLATMDSRSWRRGLALAGQDIELLDGTVYDNIAYGCSDPSPERIEAAARDVDADSFIRALPQGYGTEVGTRALSLSGGQRQRIGLARALVREPQLLILDEATNAVDGISEAVILAALRRRAGRATTLVISHHASTLSACDHGIVVDRGRVLEVGPLKQLTWYKRAYSIDKERIEANASAK